MAVCYEFQKNSHETVRAQVTEFNGRPVLDLRSHFRPEGADELAPTKKGLTLQISQLPELEAAVRALREAVDARGLAA